MPPGLLRWFMTRILIIATFMLSPSFVRAGTCLPDCSGHHRFAAAEQQQDVRDSAMLGYDVHHYLISLRVSDTSTYLSGYTEVTATALHPLDTLVFELSSVYQVDSVFQLPGQPCSFRQGNDLIRIAPGIPPGRGELFSVRVWYHGQGGQASFFVGISSRTDLEWEQKVTYTLTEPFRARDWFVCKQVLGDKADSADVWLTVDEGLKAGSNGRLEGIDSLPGGKLKFRWRTRYPIAYYLLSLSVSRYRDYSFYMHSDNLPDSLLVQNYIYQDPGYLEENREKIDTTAELIDLFSGLFSPYPFLKEKYGHCLAPIGGGMEHQTMTTLTGFGFNLVAHELTHQWFGDHVTCATWSDIWINEGFASYGEYLALDALDSHQAALEWMARAHELAIGEPEGSVYVPEEDAGNEYRIFSNALSYKKGASILHMIRYELGSDTLFFRTLREFQNRFADSVATGRDFMQVLNEVSGKEFNWFFDQWYYGQGYPEFLFTWWQSGDSLKVEVSQVGSSAVTPFFRTDMDLDLQFESGGDTLVRVLVDRPHLITGFAIKVPVANLVPDPEDWILDKSTVLRKITSAAYLRVSPNPFGDELKLHFREGAGNREIILSDMNGRVLERRFSSSGTFTLNTRNLIQGIYLLKVNEGKESYTTKVIRQ